MKKKIFIALFLSLFVYSRSAYAIFDVMAAIETIMEIKEEVEHKIEEVRKLKEDMEKNLKQGFAMATSCYKDPLKCNPDDLVGYFDGMKTAKDQVESMVEPYAKTVFVMPEATQMEEASKVPSQDLMNEVNKTYVYKKGQGQDIDKLQKNRQNINAVVANETALLFAKAITTRHSIQKETDVAMYPHDFSNGDIDAAINATAWVNLLTATRLARILELRAGMISSEATSGLTQQSNNPDDTDD